MRNDYQLGYIAYRWKVKTCLSFQSLYPLRHPISVSRFSSLTNLLPLFCVIIMILVCCSTSETKRNNNIENPLRKRNQTNIKFVKSVRLMGIDSLQWEGFVEQVIEWYFPTDLAGISTERLSKKAGFAIWVSREGNEPGCLGE